MESDAHEYFMMPPDLEMKEALVDVQLRKSLSGRRIYRYSLQFLGKSPGVIDPVINSWNTRLSTWEKIRFEEPLIVPISQIANVEETRSSDTPHADEVVAILLDCSSSMLTQDYDSSRWDFVLNELDAILHQKPDNQQIIVIGFSGETTTILPYSTDTKNHSSTLLSYQIGTLEDGTAIGDAIMLGLHKLTAFNSKNKRLVLITDGDDNVSDFQPKFSASIAADMRVPIYSIGLGKEGHFNSPVSKGRHGEYIYGVIESKPPPSIIHEIADITGGKSFEVQTGEAFQDAWNEAINSPRSAPTMKANLDKILLDIYLENARLMERKLD